MIWSISFTFIFLEWFRMVSLMMSLMSTPAPACHLPCSRQIIFGVNKCRLSIIYSIYKVTRLFPLDGYGILVIEEYECIYTASNLNLLKSSNHSKIITEEQWSCISSQLIGASGAWVHSLQIFLFWSLYCEFVLWINTPTQPSLNHLTLIIALQPTTYP